MALREASYRELCAVCRTRTEGMCRRCGRPLCPEHAPTRRRRCDACEADFAVENSEALAVTKAAMPDPDELAPADVSLWPRWASIQRVSLLLTLLGTAGHAFWPGVLSLALIVVGVGAFLVSTVGVGFAVGIAQLVTENRTATVRGRRRRAKRALAQARRRFLRERKPHKQLPSPGEPR